MLDATFETVRMRDTVFPSCVAAGTELSEYDPPPGPGPDAQTADNDAKNANVAKTTNMTLEERLVLPVMQFPTS